MPNFSVREGRDGSFYVVDLSSVREVEGRPFYRIVGNVGGYASVNAAWAALLALSRAQEARP